MPKNNIKLIIIFVAIQVCELFVFSCLLQKTAEDAPKENAQIKTEAPSDRVPNPEQENSNKNLLEASLAQPTKITLPSTDNNNMEAVITIKENKHETDTINTKNSEDAYSKASQILEVAIRSGYWTEENTKTLLENKQNLTAQQLTELTATFYMHLHGGQLEFQGIELPL